MNTYEYMQVSRDVAIDTAKRLLVDSIWKEANIELIGGITFPETNEIFEGRVPHGIDVEKVIVVNNLKRAWRFLFDQLDYNVDYQTLCEYNNIIGEGGLYHSPGVLRASIVRISGTKYIPPIPSFDTVNNAIHVLVGIENPVDKALTAFCLTSKGQWFNNGNKRTAQLVANHILLQSGAGIFSISGDDAQDFSMKLIKYYEDDDIESFKDWLYLHAVSMLPSGLNVMELGEVENTSKNTYKYMAKEVRHRSRKNVPITKDMVRTVYEYARKVYDGEMRRVDAIREVSETSGMSEGSASDYLNNYRILRSGGSLRRQMKVDDIELFLTWIKQDFGKGELDSAKKVVKNALAYWKTLPTHPNIEKIERILEKI
jgi:prophage maintenance system killer protein